jgi:hypothetical protein
MISKSKLETEMTQVFTPHYLCDRDFLLCTGYNTQKREAAPRAASLFWVLYPNKIGDSYINVMEVLDILSSILDKKLIIKFEYD